MTLCLTNRYINTKCKHLQKGRSIEEVIQLSGNFCEFDNEQFQNNFVMHVLGISKKFKLPKIFVVINFSKFQYIFEAHFSKKTFLPIFQFLSTRSKMNLMWIGFYINKCTCSLNHILLIKLLTLSTVFREFLNLLTLKCIFFNVVAQSLLAKGFL